MIDRVQQLKRSNPAKWYRQIRVMANMNKEESCITPPSSINPSDLDGVANFINQHFASVANDLPPLNLANVLSFEPFSTDSFVVQPRDVYNKLKRIKSGKAGGPDGIPSKIIKKFLYKFSFPFANISN